MRVHKITPYDEGQILIKASDCLLECAKELEETKPEWSKILTKYALNIGDIFNNHGSHKFYIRSNKLK